MNRLFVFFAVLCLSLTVVSAVTPGGSIRSELRLERGGGKTGVWIEVHGPDGRIRRSLLRTTGKAVEPGDTGGDPSGRAAFASWDEEGQRWFSFSRDSGRNWAESRRLSTAIRLLDGDVEPGDEMPAVEEGLGLPLHGSLFIIQFKTVGLPEWRETLGNLGVEVLSHIPHNSHIVRVDGDLLPAIRALDFIERVEPYHPSYRLEPELRESMQSSGYDDTEPHRVRVMTFEWGAEGKLRVIDAAESLGATVAGYWPSGHILELWATHEQIRVLAAHDDVQWIDRWTPAENDMDLVREDSGTNWVENNHGYCGQGVRGEVMDAGIQADHPDFDGILLHGSTGVDSHGTSTYGIVFGNGDRDGDGNGQGTGHLPCEGHQGIFADHGWVFDRFAHTQELKGAPYNASFQSNSWGGTTTTAYTSSSSEMDDIIWQLDIAITQSQSNTGNRNSRPQAWAKNIISVGAVRHYNTLDTADDAWGSSGSIGPAADGRIKPDVSYWYDSIYTTTTGSSYTPSFGGTSSATPSTAGIVGLIVEMWADNVWETDPSGATVFERQPHASTIKALLINSANQYDFVGDNDDLTRVHQGWGRASARTAYERAARSLVVDEEVLLELDETVTYGVAVPEGESELKVTMVYPDPPGTTSSVLHRINDVNLKVTSPSATVYHGNFGLDAGVESVSGGAPNGVDTVENVFVRNPEAGIWEVEISAAEVNQDARLDTPADDVTFALVVTGGTGLYTDGAADVRFMQSPGTCDRPFTVRVRDGNLSSSTVSVNLWSDSEAVPETVVLRETASGSGHFTGEIPTTGGPAVPGDGEISTVHGDDITVEYIDVDDGAGGTDIPRQDIAIVDCQAPVISGVGASDITNVAATITWTTDEGSDSSVDWGPITPPGDTEARAGASTSHTVRLTGLTECTTYYYSVAGRDLVGNLAVDDNDGSYFHFVTLKKTGTELHSCRDGRLVIEAPGTGCDWTVPVRLSDADLNTDPGVAETVSVHMTSSTEILPEILVLTEIGPDSDEFTGSMDTGPGPAVPGDGILQTSDGDLVTVRHDDDDDGTGSVATSFDTVVADCSGADVHSVAVSAITDESATVSWSTSEVATGYVEWGTTPSLGNLADSPTLKTSHSVSLGLFGDCDRIYFRITATDAYGYLSVADDGGAPFEFNAGTIPGVFFRDEFGTDLGWTLEGEWEIDEPMGLGSAPGDPVSAYSGANVLGHDLTGLGTYPGNYEPSTAEEAVSPSIDCTTLTNAELLFQRYLNVANGSRAYLDVRDGAGTWNTIYASPTIGGFGESSWNALTYNISPYADGNSDLRIRFRQVSHTGSSYDAGWNIDRLIVRDGSQPDIDVCGGCGGAPAFAGLISVVDDDPCADSGITVRWAASPAWGTGSTGTYAVYRDTAPGFTPGPGNLAASGIDGVQWNDPAPPDDVTLYYLVRAENDETCASGPANGGVIDTNLAYGEVVDTTGQPVPGAVGNTLYLDSVNRAHARLTWSPAPDAAVYRVYRSVSANGIFDIHAEESGTQFEDRDVFGDEQPMYYLVRSSDSCGNETP